MTKLSVDRLVAISCSHTRALVPRRSSTAHARLSSFQYTDNVLEAAVRLLPTQIIAVLLNYCDTAQLYLISGCNKLCCDRLSALPLTQYSVFRVVEYANYDDMRNALRKLDGAELNGRRLKLTEDYRGSRRKR